MRTGIVVLALAAAAASMGALAATPLDQQRRLEAQARAANPAFRGFSAEQGERFFKQGKHAKTGKSIAALAPGANPERFTQDAAVDKWFRRNCNDVLGRVCTAQEKGDVLQYLLSLK